MTEAICPKCAWPWADNKATKETNNYICDSCGHKWVKRKEICNQ